MKKCKCILLLLTLMMTLCSCGNNKSIDIYGRVYDKYKNFKSYRCDVELTVNSNKTTRHYEVRQVYKAPDKYRIEVNEPSNIKGLTTVYNGTNVTTLMPEVGGKYALQNFNPVGESYTFLPDFFKTYYKSEQTSVQTMTRKHANTTLLNTQIPGNNIHRYSQSLWVDNATLLPVRMEVYDIKNKPVISILYHNFEFNPDMKDELFTTN